MQAKLKQDGYEEWQRWNPQIYLLRKSRASQRLEAGIDKNGNQIHRWHHPHDNPDLLDRKAHITTLHLIGWDGKVDSLEKMARDFYSKKLQGKQIANTDTNSPFGFYAEGKGEALAGIKHPYDAEVVSALSRLVRRGIHIDTWAPDHRREHDTKAFHAFVSPAQN